jgi:hypothetical protein
MRCVKIRCVLEMAFLKLPRVCTNGSLLGRYTWIRFSDRGSMLNANQAVEQFRATAAEKPRFLETTGFRRAVDQEDTSSTGGSVVYVGKYVGFLFSIDIRDEQVDAQVVKVRNGVLNPIWRGGYSSDIYTHLVRHGFRGRAGRSRDQSGRPIWPRSVDDKLDSWIDLIQNDGEALLRDHPDSLP